MFEVGSESTEFSGRCITYLASGDYTVYSQLIIYYLTRPGHSFIYIYDREAHPSVGCQMDE